jgi:hypothetical protein
LINDNHYYAGRAHDIACASALADAAAAAAARGGVMADAIGAVDGAACDGAQRC